MNVLITLQKNVFKRIRQEKGKARAAGESEKRRTEHQPWKKIGCGYEDHLISKCLKPPKKIEKRKKQVRFNKKCNFACDKGENESDNIYIYIYGTYV